MIIRIFRRFSFLTDLTALFPQIPLYPFFCRQNLINSFDEKLRIAVKIKTYCLLLCVTEPAFLRHTDQMR